MKNCNVQCCRLVNQTRQLFNYRLQSLLTTKITHLTQDATVSPHLDLIQVIQLHKSLEHHNNVYLAETHLATCKTSMMEVFTIIRCSHRRCSVKKVVLRKLVKFRKNSCLRPATLLKKSLRYRCFSLNFAKFLRTSFLQNTSGDCI